MSATIATHLKNTTHLVAIIHNPREPDYGGVPIAYQFAEAGLSFWEQGALPCSDDARQTDDNGEHLFEECNVMLLMKGPLNLARFIDQAAYDLTSPAAISEAVRATVTERTVQWYIYIYVRVHSNLLASLGPQAWIVLEGIPMAL